MEGPNLRHSLADISWQVTEPEYRADPALSQSTLSKYERNGRFTSLPTLFDHEETPALKFGNIVDALVTGGYADFDSTYAIVDTPSLSDALMEITQALFDNFGDSFSFADIPDEAIAQIGKDHNYYAGDKYANYRVKQIRENCGEYYNILASSQGKIVITQQEYDEAVACHDALRNSQYTKFYFGTPDNETIERYYQLKFKHTDPTSAVAYRCMSDLLLVNHEDKTILPIDLKTSSKPEWEFYKSFVQWRYDIQAKLYWRIIKANMDKDIYYQQFKLLDYRFIVVNKKTLAPMVWEFPETKSTVELEYKSSSGYNVTMRDPYVIGAELQKYLNEQPKYPIEATFVNNISEYLRH